MYCAHCGYQNSEGAEYCQNCGTRLVSNSVVRSHAGSEYAEGNAGSHPSSPRRITKRHILVVLAIAAACFAITFFISFAAFGGLGALGHKNTYVLQTLTIHSRGDKAGQRASTGITTTDFAVDSHGGLEKLTISARASEDSAVNVARIQFDLTHDKNGLPQSVVCSDMSAVGVSYKELLAPYGDSLSLRDIEYDGVNNGLPQSMEVSLPGAIATATFAYDGDGKLSGLGFRESATSSGVSGSMGSIEVLLANLSMEFDRDANPRLVSVGDQEIQINHSSGLFGESLSLASGSTSARKIVVERDFAGNPVRLYMTGSDGVKELLFEASYVKVDDPYPFVKASSGILISALAALNLVA